MSTVTLDGATVATVGYDTFGEVSGVTYPFGTLGSLLKYPSGAVKGDTWSVSVATARTFTEAIGRSQSGRVMGASWVDSAGAGSGVGWGYSYDAVGRLTQAVLSSAGSRPQVTFGYSFAKTGGCGADVAAGANGSRTGSTVQIGTGTATSSSYCYDQASRLTQVTGANPISTITYDGHGNATRIGDQTWTYDAADRVSGAGVVSTGEALVYTRDTTGRVVKRVATGPDAGTARYGFSAGDDSPDFQLDASGKITERYLSLPGGVLVTKPYADTPQPTTWSVPNWHGDITAQASVSTTGVVTVTGAGRVADLYGQPLNQTTGVVDTAATPATRSGTSSTDAWLGQHQRGYEHSAGLNQMLMGARTYLPALGAFTSRDPVPGGSATDYDYCNQDPVNGTGLDGHRPNYRKAAGIAAFLLVGMGTRSAARSNFLGRWAANGFGMGVAWVASRLGASCRAGEYGMRVCYSKGRATDWMVGGGGMATLGNTLVVKSDQYTELTPARWGHEYEHSLQWQAAGPVRYAVAYGVASLVDWALGSKSRQGCLNVFEWAAGFVGGGYTNC